jgi:hypothetical protein
LRRSVLDDEIVLPRLNRRWMRGPIYRAMNVIDIAEERIPGAARFGFLAGAVGVAS